MSEHKSTNQLSEHQMPKQERGITRRQFLLRSATVALAMPLLGACSVPYPTGSSTTEKAVTKAVEAETVMYTPPTQLSHVHPASPIEYASIDGELNISMDARNMIQRCHVKTGGDPAYELASADLGVFVVNDTPQDVPVDGINKQYPAPTLRVSQDDNIRIMLTNNLFSGAHRKPISLGLGTIKEEIFRVKSFKVKGSIGIRRKCSNGNTIENLKKLIVAEFR